MNRLVTGEISQASSVPRTRGDEPPDAIVMMATDGRSPHPRG